MTDTLTIHISEYGLTAFSSQVPLDFGSVQGCKAYYAALYSYGKIHLKEVKGVAPAHFGMVIAAADGVTEVTVPIATREQEEQCGLSNCDNFFIATDEAEYHAPPGEHNIGLGVKDGIPGFYNIAEGTVIPKGKWYMPKLPETPLFKILFHNA